MSEETETPEETALLLRMATSIPAPGQYTDMDRFRDFKKVFMTDDGQRVLRELLAWGHLFKPSFDKDPYVMAFREGERNMSLKLLIAITKEPKERPAQANSKQAKD